MGGPPPEPAKSFPDCVDRNSTKSPATAPSGTEKGPRESAVGALHVAQGSAASGIRVAGSPTLNRPSAFITGVTQAWAGKVPMARMWQPAT